MSKYRAKLNVQRMDSGVVPAAAESGDAIAVRHLAKIILAHSGHSLLACYLGGTKIFIFPVMSVCFELHFNISTTETAKRLYHRLRYGRLRFQKRELPMWLVTRSYIPENKGPIERAEFYTESAIPLVPAQHLCEVQGLMRQCTRDCESNRARMQRGYPTNFKY
ncbi:uncharacterized protein BDR25DRAFT_351461 [Lindgomyces ingoldianus]|uniref:Uncharacterized protein n=1 Tax=Lindgomyces ingoldianus TaxID=673940 RepID=A0ACB6R732_9PLEO|nr:uncharacterized protein BDR25DRAFT_351461 [Lindgomyces ingoldianus]KAF2474971.1 hypothetical protein BDR25DRAFT_351461 [Lindgomyces ingoldianus]